MTDQTKVGLFVISAPPPPFTFQGQNSSSFPYNEQFLTANSVPNLLVKRLHVTSVDLSHTDTGLPHQQGKEVKKNSHGRDICKVFIIWPESKRAYQGSNFDCICKDNIALGIPLMLHGLFQDILIHHLVRESHLQR